MGKQVAIIGAGAAGLMAADRLSALRPDLAITLYDAMASPARKILMAGKSGLNITHSEPIEAFTQRYGAASRWMDPMLAQFGPQEVVAWVEGLGQEVFVGSSGRVFPKAMKASVLLRALLHRLQARGVRLEVRHRWQGWQDGRADGALLFDTPQGARPIEADAILLAMGGPSWPRLGTDGAFIDALETAGLEVAPYLPANCGFDVAWSTDFAERWAGHPVKSVTLRGPDGAVCQGDFVITQHGIEGSAVYPLSAGLRAHCEQQSGGTILHVDLRPHQSLEALVTKLSRPRGKQSVSNFLRKNLNLTGMHAALLKECTDRAVMAEPEHLARAVKALPIPVLRPRPLAEAISCAGGVRLDQLDAHLMIRTVPGLFMAGEMLDWEAPTGGYLLTACLSQGYQAAEGIAAFVG